MDNMLNFLCHGACISYGCYDISSHVRDYSMVLVIGSKNILQYVIPRLESQVLVGFSMINKGFNIIAELYISSDIIAFE